MSRKSINSNIGGACLKCVIEERDHSMSRKSINSNIVRYGRQATV